MEIRAVHRFARISPKKVRTVIGAIAGKRVNQAFAALAVTPSRAAAMIIKVLKSAAANAENNQSVECDPEEMYITRATVDGGPSLSRHKFGARGRVVPRLRRMSHITISLSEKTGAEEALNKKDEN